MSKIKVLVVDDSALIRKLLTEIINNESDMEVIGAAADPLVAREMIRETNPDVLTLDVEMPRMDGIDFLEKLMRLRPMPVVMVSTLTEKGSEVTFRALELGAVDFVSKPKIGIADGLKEYSGEITKKTYSDHGDSEQYCGCGFAITVQSHRLDGKIDHCWSLYWRYGSH